MEYVLVPILVVLVAAGVIVWFLKWTADTKEWCVMMYFVAQHHADLDAKLQQVLDELDNLPCNSKSGEESQPGWDNVHVVYRALWSDSTKAPEAGVIHWRPLTPKAMAFGSAAVVGDLTDDLHGFFDWAYDNFPARRYAVFFWGHSFGPGGIFEQNQPVIIDPPPSPVVSWQGINLPAIAQGFARIVDRRKGTFQPEFRSRIAGPVGTSPQPLTPPPPPPTPSPTPTPPTPPALPPVPPAMKVEVVLFQDCWMSTLETMYTLEDSVQYVIGSQSLVPIGVDSTGAPEPTAIWPYRKLIDSLLTQPQFADAMLQQMQQYFDASTATRFPSPCVPFSLLDLGIDTGQVRSVLTAPFRQLVTALEPLGRIGRKQLIMSRGSTAGRFARYDAVDTNILRVGEESLIDVITLCDYLHNDPTAFAGVTFTTGQDMAIRAAALAVRTALLGDGTIPPLVRGVFESVETSPTDNVGFKGVSVLYKGESWPTEFTLMLGVSRSTYDTLAFAQNAKVPPPPPPPAPPPPPLACWTVYAFEHSAPDTAVLTCT